MAIRSVYLSKDTYPFFEEIQVHIEWFGGFALSQKRKCEISLHQNFLHDYPGMRLLEISSSSTSPLGRKLSAMKLQKKIQQVDSLGNVHIGITTVESVFQSSKIFQNDDIQLGPFPEYLMLPGKICKQKVKECSNGLHSYKYEYSNSVFYAPDYHISLFYDFIYLNALLESQNKPITLELISSKYTAFSDLATVSLNSQARSCAIFVGLYTAGLLKRVKTKQTYLELFRTHTNGTPMTGAYEKAQIFKSGKTTLLSPIVPCYHDRNSIEKYYEKHYSHLSNRRDNEFIPYWIT